MHSSLEPLCILHCRYGTAELLRGEIKRTGRKVSVPIRLTNGSNSSWEDGKADLEEALQRTFGTVPLVIDGDLLIIEQHYNGPNPLPRFTQKAGMMLAYLEQVLSESASRKDARRRSSRGHDRGREYNNHPRVRT